MNKINIRFRVYKHMLSYLNNELKPYVYKISELTFSGALQYSYSHFYEDFIIISKNIEDYEELKPYANLKTTIECVEALNIIIQKHESN